MLDKDLSLEAFDPGTRRPAGFWIRFAAYFIDFLILLIFAVISLFVKSVAAYVLLMAPVIAYKPVFEGLLGGTPGKIALGLRVVGSDGKLLGLAGGVVRSGLFLLPVIPSMILHVKMIQQGISPLDVAAVQEFQKSNELLNIAYYGLSLLLVISCVVVAFNRNKRGLHDFIADSYVFYHEKGGAVV